MHFVYINFGKEKRQKKNENNIREKREKYTKVCFLNTLLLFIFNVVSPYFTSMSIMHQCFLSLSVCMFVCLYVCLSVCMFVCLCVCLPIFNLFVFPSINLSFRSRVPISLYIYISLYLSIHLHI